MNTRTDPEFAHHVLRGEPVNPCRGCKRCRWFTDHTKCPGVRALAGKNNGTAGIKPAREREEPP